MILYESNELKHYGVLGMKWGVRRASKKLSKATTDEARDKAISKLNKHRKKATAKIEKLGKERVGLQKSVDKYAMKGDVKAAKLQNKIQKYKRKAGGFFTSEEKAAKLLSKADVLQFKVDSLRAGSAEAKAKLEKNKTLTRIFEEGVSSIDYALINKGKRLIKG